MAEYLSPGVYTESVSKGGAVVEAVSASTGGFIGFASRGTVNKAVFINSWSAYLNEFAGDNSAFETDKYLAYAVYGFFQNGGKRCYVVRTAGSGIAKATAEIGGLTFTAKNEGTWGNNIKVAITKNADFDSNFDVSVNLYDSVGGSNVVTSEKFKNLTLADIFDTVNSSSTLVAIDINPSAVIAVAPETSLESGADGENVPALTTDILNSSFGDVANEISLICSPDLKSQADANILIGYAEANRMFAIIQGTGTEGIAEIKSFRKGLNSGPASLYYPYIEVTDPLSSVGAVKSIPPCGHIMGIYAKTITNKGVWKNPAGVECAITGVVSTHKISATQGTLATADVDVLNPLSINAIMLRPNYGICVWGCRSLMSDTTLRYVADVLLKFNVMKSLQEGTQALVFEPHDRDLWTKANATVKAFLDTLWREGAFLGDTSAEAYYVKCDESNNPEESRNLGRLIIECGYAQKKPAEFVIIKIAHQIQN